MVKIVIPKLFLKAYCKISYTEDRFLKEGYQNYTAFFFCFPKLIHQGRCADTELICNLCTVYLQHGTNHC